MSQEPGHTRSAREEDHDEIDALLRVAFEQPDEAALVRQLRADGDMWFELVKEWDGRIAAYAGLSRMQSPEGWACLAPVAVWPAFQRGVCAPDPAQSELYAFGTRLVREIATVVGAAEKPFDFPACIVVLGDPGFYGRAGFSASRAQNLQSPYPIDHTLLAGGGEDAPAMELRYPAAFGDG